MISRLQTDIPVAPIRRVLNDWLKRNAAHESPGDTTTSMSAHERLCLAAWPSSRRGTSERILRRILSEQEAITFDLADKILCRLHLSHLWREDPELASIYQGFDLRPLDLMHPTCEAVEKKNQARIKRMYARTGSKSAIRRSTGLGANMITRILAAAA